MLWQGSNTDLEGVEMTQPKRQTIKTDRDARITGTVEDPDGQWIFDPSHKINISNYGKSEYEQRTDADAKIRMDCAILDQTCIDCEGDCPAAGE